MAIWTRIKFFDLKFIKRAKTLLKTPGSQTPERKINPSERGSIAVIFALAMVVLLGSCAIVVDIGLLYVQKAKLQNTVDSAALAGVQELPGDTSKATDVAKAYALQNGTENITTRFEANNFKIIISAQKTVPTYFAKIWGINSEQISATARAMMLPPTSMSGAVPLSVQEQNFEYGALYTLKSGSSDQPGPYSGWFGALRLSGSGAKTYETDLAYGYQGTLSFGQIVDVEPGNMSGPTQKGIETRFAQDQRVPRNTFADYGRNAPEIIYVPIVHLLDANKQVQIVGFAAFFLEGIPGNGNDSIITGRFIKTLIPGNKTEWSLTDLLKKENDISAGISTDAFGLYTPKLVAQ
ncbi:pilus assembly protein TadG-related protein [Desulfitobacterium sp.]|uniref:pilus assembly protein TadG-related protein n=1 Tax=Desulfitobacterium sp. TaxID=49981 RepID=UPI002C935C76|nr:pilus assembly protein TadG-related protein [Desulfitobacterium sp.]HVJ48566.1 pilus assembly protein TadG-related protein [Desulfitobacterium sp.]